MEELNLENIFNAEEIDNFFAENSPFDSSSTKGEEETNENEDNNNITEVVKEDNFFEPESVGNEDIQGKEDTETSKSNSPSPNKNFYSSIAEAFKEEGIFPDLEDNDFNNINSPEDFRELIDKQIRAGIDERNKRIDDALNYQIEPSAIKYYENTIQYLDNISEDAITNESEQGETLRKNLIYQDFINRGYSKERAVREVKKSMDSGSDIEDAKEALISNKEFYNSQYNNLIEESKQERLSQEKERKARAERLKKSIIDDEKILGDLIVDKSTRKKVFDNISKPTYRDDEGNYYTALQKYQSDNPEEFIKHVGLLFTLTDGFKNIDGLVKNKVKKEVSKGLRNLERTINNTSRTSDGSLMFVNNNDTESFISGKWDLDV